MKLTEHFTTQEFERSNTAIRLGLSNVCPDKLMPNMLLVAEKLEQVRAHFNAPVRILSVYRSPLLNSAVGGSASSAHLQAMAADFTVDGHTPLEVCQWCADNIEGYDQIIHEFAEWTHMGFAEKPRKQLLTATKVDGKTKYSNGLA